MEYPNHLSNKRHFGPCTAKIVPSVVSTARLENCLTSSNYNQEGWMCFEGVKNNAAEFRQKMMGVSHIGVKKKKKVNF